MDYSAAIYDLARAGHQIWCDQMIASGWRPGASFDEQGQVHDALVPFDQLRRVDQLVAITALDIEGMPDAIAALVAPDRSASRVFSPDELREGLAVGWGGSSPTPSEPGKLISWELDEDGDVTLMRIEWRDGRIEDYDPFERLLRRLE